MRVADMEGLLEGLLTAHGIGKMTDSKQADANRPAFRSAATSAQVRPSVTARATQAARRGLTLTRQQNQRRPASARPASAQASSVSGKPAVGLRPASASSRSSSVRKTPIRTGSEASLCSSPLPAWCVDKSRVRTREPTPPTAGMMLEFAARRGVGEDVKMAECDGKAVLPDRFDPDAAAKGPNGELRFRDYTAEEEQGAARLRAAVEAYCARNNLSVEATQAHITKELTNYDNALGRKDTRIRTHDQVCPIEQRREMQHVPGMRIFMGDPVDPDDPEYRFDRTSAVLAPTPPSTPPSTPPRKQRIPTPKPDFPWALDKSKHPASKSTDNFAKPRPEQSTRPGGDGNSEERPDAWRSTPAPVSDGPAVEPSCPPHSGAAAAAVDDAETVRSSYQATPPPQRRAAERGSPQHISARASVQHAKRVVGKAVWQRMDKSERVKIAVEMRKWMGSTRPAKQTSRPSSASGSMSPPGTPVGVKIGHTVARLQNMRLDRRIKPQMQRGLQLCQNSADESAVTVHGAWRAARSHTPPDAPPRGLRVAEVW
eukprot:COSAG02_NODE_2607_length_8436_cov_3.451841_3_plen_543_part_00